MNAKEPCKTLKQLITEKWKDYYTTPDGTLRLNRDLTELYQILKEWLEQKRPSRLDDDGVLRWHFLDELLEELK